MFILKYEIKKDNETNRPYVEFLDDNTDYPEHKFMAMEVTRYLLNGILVDNEEMKELSEETEIEIARANHVIEQIADQIGFMINEQNSALDDLGVDIKNDDN